MKRVIKIALSALTIAFLLVFSAIPVFAEQTNRVQFGNTLYIYDDDPSAPQWYSKSYPLNSGYHTVQIGGVLNRSGVYRVRVPFETPIQFKAGNYYTLHYEVQFAFESSKQLDPDFVYELDISIDGVAPYSSKGSYSSDRYVTVRNDTSFYCNSDFTSDYLYVTIDNWSEAGGNDPYMSLWSFRYDTLSSTEYQNQVITGAITNQTTQIQNQIDQSTQDILQGSGLTGPVMPDTSDEESAMDDIKDKEDEIEDLLGGYDKVTEDVENIMDVELDSDIVSALSSIRDVFTRLVDTLQISSLITFMLVMGLGLYILGRRTS